jgi:large repetitive protein
VYVRITILKAYKIFKHDIMKLRSKILYRCLLMPALLIAALSCDDMSKDVVPSQEKIDQATDLTSTLGTQGPVLVNLVSGSNLTGNATISIVEKPAKGTLAILNSALLMYTPNADFDNGTDHAIYQVCVGGDCDTGRIDFNYVTPDGQCRAAAVYDHAVGKPTDAQVVIDVLKNDITCGGQFDVSTLKVVTQPEHGDAAPVDGLIFYHPEGGFQGTVHLIYSAALRTAPSVLYYGAVDIELAPAPVAVTAINDAFNYTYAEFVDLSYSGTRMNYSLESILGNDQIGGLTYNDLTITITRQPAHGTVTYYSRELFQWVPGSVFSGTDSFAYQICANGQCSEGEVQITIAEQEGPKPTPMPDDVVMTRAEYDDRIQAGYLYFTYQTIIGNDDFDGVPESEVQIMVSAQPEYGTVTYLSPDVFKFVPSANFAGETFFKYMMCYNGQCTQATVTITVTGW